MAFVGVTMNVHYCHDNIKSIDFFAQGEQCCCNNQAASNGCCSNKIQHFQLDDEESLPVSYNFRFDNSYVAIPAPQIKSVIVETIQMEVGFDINDISPPTKYPRWILNCSLTYYG